MFVLTARFDFSKDHGRFLEEPPGALPLKTSLNWLKLDIPSGGVEPMLPATAFDPEAPGLSWTDLGDAGTLLIPAPIPAHNPYPAGVPFDHILGIYVTQGSGGVPLTDPLDTVELVACWGRPVKVRNRLQPYASPITDSGNPATPGGKTDRVKTTFIHPPKSKGASVGWFFPLGQISIRPDDPGTKKFLSHRYEFSIGIIVKDVSTGQVRYYGQDPEVDIGQD